MIHVTQSEDEATLLAVKGCDLVIVYKTPLEHRYGRFGLIYSSHRGVCIPLHKSVWVERVRQHPPRVIFDDTSKHLTERSKEPILYRDSDTMLLCYPDGNRLITVYPTVRAPNVKQRIVTCNNCRYSNRGTCTMLPCGCVDIKRHVESPFAKCPMRKWPE